MFFGQGFTSRSASAVFYTQSREKSEKPPLQACVTWCESGAAAGSLTRGPLFGRLPPMRSPPPPIVGRLRRAGTIG